MATATMTGAWSTVPVAAGAVGVVVTATVGGDVVVPGGPLLLGWVASVPIEVNVPDVEVPSARVMVTASPAWSSDRCDASMVAVTSLVVDVAVSMGPPAGTGPPRV